MGYERLSERSASSYEPRRQPADTKQLPIAAPGIIPSLLAVHQLGKRAAYAEEVPTAGGPTGVYFLAFFLSEPQAAPYREVDQPLGTIGSLLLRPRTTFQPGLVLGRTCAPADTSEAKVGVSLVDMSGDAAPSSGGRGRRGRDRAS